MATVGRDWWGGVGAFGEVVVGGLARAGRHWGRVEGCWRVAGWWGGRFVADVFVAVVPSVDAGEGVLLFRLSL